MRPAEHDIITDTHGNKLVVVPPRESWTNGVFHVVVCAVKPFTANDDGSGPTGVVFSVAPATCGPSTWRRFKGAGQLSEGIMEQIVRRCVDEHEAQRKTDDGSALGWATQRVSGR